MTWRAALLRLAMAAGTALLIGLQARAETPVDCPPPAQALTPEQVQTGQREARDHGFLWRISKGGRHSYLYGTVHVGTWRSMFPGPTVAQALKESDTIALELDLQDPDILRRMRIGMAARREVALPAALQARLQAQMAAACIAPEALAGMGPELKIATLSIMVGRRDGLDAAYGIDNFLAGLGHGTGKRVVSLETPEQQLQVLQMDDAAATQAMVESGLDDLESGRARPLLKRLADLWADADEAELMRYPDWCECVKTEADRDLLKRLLDDRNPDLAAAIDALHGGGANIFAAVGSLHMIGPLGLPALLARRGYEVERVAYPQ